MEPNAVLVAIRRAAELTQSEMADRMGWTQGFVSQLESGERRINNHALDLSTEFSREMKRLGCGVEDLLRGRMPRKRRGAAA